MLRSKFEQIGGAVNSGTALVFVSSGCVVAVCVRVATLQRRNRKPVKQSDTADAERVPLLIS